jgi:uncharacterized protein (TIGR02569 family)
VRPSPAAVAAFGLEGEPVALGGGQGGSWRVGTAVLKPVDLSPAELAWQAELLEQVETAGFRVSRPLRAGDGSLSVDGWCAREWLEGVHEARRWADVIAAGERFHAALRGVPRPAFLDERGHQWAVGDRVAWGELPGRELAHVKHVPSLLAALERIDAPSQLIHGDLTGNVLFAAGLPPAVIDFSPYQCTVRGVRRALASAKRRRAASSVAPI